MKPVIQTIFDGDAGNCLSASIASILELQLDEVPNFAQAHGDEAWQHAEAWLSQRGMRLLEIGFADYDTYCDTYFANSGEFCIVTGPSTHPDRAHAVVGQVNSDGAIELAHDPIPHGHGPLPGWRRIYFICALLAQAS